MNSIFISGIPAAGKTHLALRLHKKTGLPILSTDRLRENMAKDSTLKNWVHFFFDKDEREYFSKTSCKDHWFNLVKQSEAFWPEIIKAVKDLEEKGPCIVESVNLLPHLANKHLKFSGTYLIGESEKEIFIRLQNNPRWGKTKELQKIEADRFYNCEGRCYKEEAGKYGYQTSTNTEEAYRFLLKMIDS